LIGIELVGGSDKTPLAEAEVVQIQKRIRQNGVIVGRNSDTVTGFGNVLTISPPLILNDSEAGQIVEAVRAALKAHRS
jgi:4-aminobutyrate aminotransferase-like enzyme